MKPPSTRTPLDLPASEPRRMNGDLGASFRHFRALAFVLLCCASAVHAETIDARLDWAQRTELSTPLSGIIAEVNGVPGAKVAKGDLLIRLDDRQWRAELARAEAALDEAQALKQEAERELERNQELYERTVLSDHALRMAEIEAARANAAWRRAQAELTRARLELEWTRISAPFDGRILAVAKQPGEVIVNRLRAEPLMVVAGDRLLARAEISAQTAARLAIGDAIAIEPGSGETQGRLASIRQNGEGDDGYRIEVMLPQTSEKLFPGHAIRLELP